MNQVKETARQITKKPEEDELTKKNIEEGSSEDEEEFIGPPLPQNFNDTVTPNLKKSSNSDSDAESDNEEDVSADRHFMPLQANTSMRHGNKAVSALTVDPSGARLASGNFTINLVSFGRRLSWCII